MKRLTIYAGICSLALLIVVGCDSVVQQKTDNGSELDKVLSGKKAGPNAIFNLDFSDPADATDNTASSAGWLVDRQAPESFESVNFDGDDRLLINIDEAGPTSGFNGYQGKKYKDADNTGWGTEANARFSYKFYIDPDWETDGVKQQTGVWPTLSTQEGNINAYPILAYEDSDANSEGEAGFKAYVYTTDEDGNFTGAEWVTIGLPKQLKIDPDEGGWVSVEAQLHKEENGAALKWRINNKLVFDERNYNYFWSGELYSSMEFHEFIFNSVNYGVDQDYYYDDIMLTKAGHAGMN